MKTNMPYNVSGPNPAEAAALAGNNAVIVSDDMSFGQAFAAARQAMGPGASFTWRGQVYGTYYQNEWDAMSPAEQQAFTMNALDRTPLDTPLEINIDEPVYADNTPVIEIDTANNVAATDVNDDSDAEVRILGYESVTEGESTINLAALDVDGQSVYMIDLDNDNVYDVMVADFDHSGEILDSADDIVPIEDISLTVDEVAQAFDAQTDTMANIEMPDMPGDDISSFDVM